MWRVGAVLGRFGVSAFLPTLVSPSWPTVARARDALAAGPPESYSGATPLGWHVEGPFLAPSRAGAHDPASLRPPSVEAVAGWSPSTGVRMVTLAPELPGALDVVRVLVANGIVVSAGHSAASYDEAVAGFEAGIRSVTHLFNAMSPLDHREPGLAGAALADDRVTIGLIPDGLHVHPAVVGLVRRIVGPRPAGDRQRRDRCPGRRPRAPSPRRPRRRRRRDVRSTARRRPRRQRDQPRRGRAQPRALRGLQRRGCGASRDGRARAPAGVADGHRRARGVTGDARRGVTRVRPS